MVNIKKIAFFILVIVFIVTGVFFYWKNEQKELANLNKSLPDGIKITKTLLNRYEVNDKIDNYSFKVPKSWDGIEYIEYLPETTEKEHTFSNIGIEGKTKRYKLIGVSKFQGNLKTDILEQATSLFNDFGLNHNFTQKRIKNIKTIKDDSGFPGEYTYIFKKGNYMYVLVGASEEFIEEIISNGTW